MEKTYLKNKMHSIDVIEFSEPVHKSIFPEGALIYTDGIEKEYKYDPKNRVRKATIEDSNYIILAYYTYKCITYENGFGWDKILLNIEVKKLNYSDKKIIKEQRKIINYLKSCYNLNINHSGLPLVSDSHAHSNSIEFKFNDNILKLVKSKYRKDIK